MNKTDQQAMASASPQAGTEAFKTALDHAGNNVLPAHTRLEGCEVIGLIGAGNYSIVYLAYDYALARHVAVKEYMPARLAARGANGRMGVQAQTDHDLYDMGLRSFLSEARLLSRFDTPSLVKIMRFWEANGTAYMAMPVYDGISLLQAVSSGRFDANEKRVRLVLEQLFDAIELLHRAHCYHPDIAPGNILLQTDGRPLLLDFGAARRVIAAHTDGPAAALRAGFAPVEDYEDIPNLKRGPWTDVYALAAVGYFLIGGKAPPPALSRMANDTMTPARQAGAARYSEPFLAALDQALAVMPQQRIQSVAEFRRALGMQLMRKAGPAPQTDGADMSTVRWPEAHGGRAAPAGPARAGPGMGAWLNDNRSAPRTALLALAVLALVAAAGFWGVRRTEPATASLAGADTASQAVVVTGKAGAPPAPTAKPAPAREKAAEAATPEDNRWRVASSLNNASAYENYLAEYPNGRYAPMARAALDSLRASAGPEESLSSPDPAMQEESLWNAVRKIDKPLAYESFLRRYPNGRYASAARGSLARLRLPSVDPRPAFEPPVVDATRRPFGTGSFEPRPGDRPPAAAPGTPVVPPAASSAPLAGAAPTPTPPAAPDRLATARPPEAPAAAARAPQATEPAAETEAEQEAAAAPSPARGGRTLRLANQIMTGNFSPDPVTGVVSGSGRIVWDNGDQFEGTLVRGQKEGKGEFRWANGQRYRGDWSRDQPNGKGSIQFPNGDRYSGDVRNGLPNGTGALVFANGNRYQGEVRDGQPNGSGTLTFANGNRYRGEVRDGLPHGTGTNRYGNGDSYTGGWRRGKSDGQGRYTWANGSYWEGEFRDDVKTANGRMEYAPDTPASRSGENPRGDSASGAAGNDRDISERAR
jgi:tRNA A-37 threonylcarbamoyl transferase component Bud32